MIGVLEKQSSFPPSMHGTRRASVRRHYRVLVLEESLRITRITAAALIVSGLVLIR